MKIYPKEMIQNKKKIIINKKAFIEMLLIII